MFTLNIRAIAEISSPHSIAERPPVDWSRKELPGVVPHSASLPRRVAEVSRQYHCLSAVASFAVLEYGVDGWPATSDLPARVFDFGTPDDQVHARSASEYGRQPQSQWLPHARSGQFICDADEVTLS